ncbi:YDG domain-containing protein [Pedobacter sp. SYSU D00535]|uniref:YDG domain-containing protein n=1 Tax=Pedobacter sp. SYSU D00535 TaxID=2810308 RepID=UPI001A95A5AE|nr:YDG domain-containing protein [Pedobacter sp. SYSU D00535]
MRKIYSIILCMLLLFITGALKAQSLSPEAIVPQGGHSRSGEVDISFTFGQPFSIFLETEGLSLSQGFQQVSPNNANLLSLTLSEGQLSPGFTSDITDYSATVGHSLSSIKVGLTAADPLAKISLNGDAVVNGSETTVILKDGSNEIVVLVTAQDEETTKQYKLNVTRLKAQAITFEQLANRVYGDGPFNLGATSNSGLKVSYESEDPAVAEIIDDQVYIKKAGSVNIKASQQGDDVYEDAESVTRLLVVDPKVLTYQFKTDVLVSKVYDGKLSAELKDDFAGYVLEGLLPQDLVSANGTAVSFKDKNVGKSKLVTITGLTLSGASAKNYVLSSDYTEAEVGEIQPKELTATLVGVVEKIYDGSKSAPLISNNYHLSDVLEGENVVLNNPTTAMYESANKGVEILVYVDGLELLGDDAANYTLAATSTKALIGEIKPKTAFVSLKGSVSKTYDGGVSANLTSDNYKLDGILSTDAVTLDYPEVGTFENKDSGTSKKVTVGDLALSGDGAKNYVLESTSIHGEVGEIKAKEVTASLIGTVSKTYDGLIDATLAPENFHLSGVLENESVVLVPVTSGTYDSKDTGAEKLVYTDGLSISGTDKFNYTLVSGSVHGPVGEIKAKELTAALVGTTSKVYDGTSSATLTEENYQLSGVLKGETVVLNNPTSGKYDSKNVGREKEVTVGQLSIDGKDASNYTLSSTEAKGLIGEVKGKEVSAGLAGVVAKTYDGTLTATLKAGNYTLDGTISSDQVGLNNPSAGTYDSKNKGTSKTVTVNGIALTGADAGNYILTSSSAQAAVGVINVKAITATAGAMPAITKVYDGKISAVLAPANLSLHGVEINDNVTVSGTASYADKNAGISKAVTVDNLVLAGEDKANYNLTTLSTGTFGNITKAVLTITADNKEKIQGLPMPQFTASYGGFVNGETSAALISLPAMNTGATVTSPQGPYPIIISGATAANYEITHVDGVLTVKPGYPTSISLAAATLFENAAAGTLAGTLSSTSDDPNATFRYELVAGAGDTDNGKFVIERNQIKTSKTLNFEEQVSYKVRLRSITQYDLPLEREFTISIQNVNEQPTIDAIANSTICYTEAQQTVALSNITAGPDANETTAVSVSSSNNSLFESLTVTQADHNRAAQVRYKLAPNASGTATVTVLVQDNGGTANGGIDFKIQSFTLTVNQLPVIAISSDKGTTLSKGEVAMLKAEVTGGNTGLTYSWADANGIVSVAKNLATLNVRPSETTTYTVTVTNANGCVSTQSITIEVLADFKVVDGTNIVTPNGDGVNDNFVIRNIDMYPNNVVKIFDRAGRLLYSKTNYTSEFNGTFEGSPLAEDTYYYIVDFGPGAEKIKGFITIVRD